MPAILQLGTEKYTALLGEGAIEELETNLFPRLGYQEIRTGVLLGKISFIVPFVFACIKDQLPLGTDVSWLRGKLGLLDADNMDAAVISALDITFPVVCALFKFDDLLPDQGDEREDAPKNESEPPTNGGLTSATSSTASLKSETPEQSGE